MLNSPDDTRGGGKDQVVSTIRVLLSLSNHLTLRVDPRQVSDLGRKLARYLTFSSSAPGESLPPLPRDMDGTVSEIRNDVIKTRAIVSELECNVTSTRTMISDIHRTTLKIQEGSDGRNLLVSDT